MKKGNMIFAERIKSYREAGGISQEELASKYGYTKQTVSSWENNGQIPRDAVLRDLASSFGTSTDYLLGLTDDPSPTMPSSTEKKPQDLKRILEHHEIMFDGVPIDDDTKEDILHIVEFELYKQAKAMNKRKPKAGEKNDK